ncbi:MAG: peptidylprolyl isomerase [Tepidiformaceae bacterium]
MPKRKRREQQHLRQQASRRSSYTVGGSAPSERYRPGFPMNVFGNIKLFSIIGVVAATSMVVVAVLTTGGSNSADPDDAVPTASASATTSVTPDASATPAGTPTPAAKQFSKAEQVIDAAKNTYTATLKTDKGEIVMELLADRAPNTVNSFAFLAKEGYFDGITFHRVVANFVVQGGDPTGKGAGGPGYQTQEEPNDLKNIRGMVSMAKAGAVTNFGSQFFINLKENTALDKDDQNQKRFYPWAQVKNESMAIVDRIAQGDIIRQVVVTETPK